MARAEVVRKVIDCRAIVDSTQRLACYDAQVARLDEAATRKEVVVVDQAEVKRTRQGLFGLNLGNIGLFGGNGGEGPDDRIESTV